MKQFQKRILPVWIIFMVCIGYYPIFAQNYPDSFYVHVTYYDYHTNPSIGVGLLNTNFEMGSCGGAIAILGMVQETLALDHKPLLQTLAPGFCNNSSLNYWFRPSGACAPSDFCAVKFDPFSGHWSGLKPYVPNSADPHEKFAPQGVNWMYTHSTTYPNMN
ncbi:MAG: hypothetical protein PHC61_17390, partial [Chitinivibrionales bacterium]|nr:hypothetical protein [Chitinivibrionales bacterium]